MKVALWVERKSSFCFKRAITTEPRMSECTVLISAAAVYKEWTCPETEGHNMEAGREFLRLSFTLGKPSCFLFFKATKFPFFFFSFSLSQINLEFHYLRPYTYPDEAEAATLSSEISLKPLCILPSRSIVIHVLSQDFCKLMGIYSFLITFLSWPFLYVSWSLMVPGRPIFLYTTLLQP